MLFFPCCRKSIGGIKTDYYTLWAGWPHAIIIFNIDPNIHNVNALSIDINTHVPISAPFHCVLLLPDQAAVNAMKNYQRELNTLSDLAPCRGLVLTFDLPDIALIHVRQTV